MSSTEGSRRWLSVLVDVAVNVLANLIAGTVGAALLYLGGALLGLFPREPKAIASAVVAILLAIFGVIVLASRIFKDGRRFIATSSAITVFGAAILIARAAGIDLGSSLEGWWGIVCGAVFFVFGLLLAWSMWMQHRRELIAGRQITGLSWYVP
jgi:hypothetical protein